jgi:hypothetical protein
MSSIDFKSIARKLESTRCRLHGKSPKASVLRDNIELNDICCDEFRSELAKKLERLVGDEVEKSIKDAFKGFK